MPQAAHPPRRSERGAALLVAVVAIAVLTALAVDLAYDTQVRLRIAGNARDELRAEALAASAVHVSRMVLGFQAQLDQSLGAACAPQATATAGAGTTGTTTTGAGTTGTGTTSSAGCLRPQIWSLVPVGSHLTQGLFGDAGVAAGPAASGATAGAEGQAAVSSLSYGDYEGGFAATIEDEGLKVNAQLDALQQSGWLGAQAEALLRLFCDAKWDPLFDRTDAEGQRTSRSDLVVHLRDWVDDDATASGLTASFPGGNCSFLVPQNPFENAFSDENYVYDRGPDRYKAKNARLDSVEELFLVAGVSDAFMAAFGDRLTVFLSHDSGGINVNADDTAQQLRVAALMAEPGSLVRLLDPAFAQALHKALSAQRMGGFLTITPVQFAQTVASLGVGVRSEYLTASPKSPFTDRALVFRVRAQGVAGDVSHQIEAVVSFDPRQATTDQRQAVATTTTTTATTVAAPGAALNLGRLIRWREE